MAIQQAMVYGRPIFEAVFDAFSASFQALNHTPVIVIFKDKTAIHCRAIVYSVPHVKLWGLDHRCIRPECDKPGNIRSKVGNAANHAFGKFSCVACGWHSEWIQRPTWIQATSKDFVFWYDYPLPTERAHYIVMKSANIPPPSS
jgi:hypothetical protein